MNAVATAMRVAPYRILFPIGVVYALIGVGLWPAYALGAIPYPGDPHRLLMIQGFELSFVLGFLLTALPGFTKGEPCRGWELAVAAIAAPAFGVATLAGARAIAASAFLAAMLLLVTALVRRVRGGRIGPPAEFVFVGFGLGAGLLGAAMQLAESLGAAAAPARFAERLVSLGMVLSLVLGVGSLLVPAFAGMRDPLTIPGIGRPHEARRRVVLYTAIVAAFTAAFALEWLGRLEAGALVRAAAAAIVGLWVWKLWRPPGRRDVPAYALWGSGWCVLLGLVLAAAWPAQTLAAWHLTFIGGFGLLTLGIATRVVVAHGRHPFADERRTLGLPVAAALAVALGARIAAEIAPGRNGWIAVSAGAWLIAWLAWSARALPRIARTHAPIVR